MVAAVMILGGNQHNEFDYLLLVAFRNSERHGPTDDIQDFRTSFLAIYIRYANDWIRVDEEPARIRSTSTAAGSPDNPSPGDVAGYVSVRGSGPDV